VEVTAVVVVVVVVVVVYVILFDCFSVCVFDILSQQGRNRTLERKLTDIQINRVVFGGVFVSFSHC